MATVRNHLIRMHSVTRKSTDVRVIGAQLFLLPVATRVPLSFGAETLTTVTCARVRVIVQDRGGRVADGWGECPLNIQWAWPGDLSYESRHEALVSFSKLIAQELAALDLWGHPLEVGNKILRDHVPLWIQAHAVNSLPYARIPELAALICCASFDLAIHDAYGCLHEVPIYETYTADFMNCDLSELFKTDGTSATDFRGVYPAAFLARIPARMLPVWHLVGISDPLSRNDCNSDERGDSYPVLLTEWIEHDQLSCLKVKLKGTDAAWDFQRLQRIGELALAENVEWLAADFNCGVREPAYVMDIMDRLASEAPRIYAAILYLEQPFAPDLTAHGFDVRPIAERKPLLMDESAHSWRHVEYGRRQGWSGVALKTCKTQTGAILSLCWAKSHDMPVMVQDLTNPMLAMIPHAQLAAFAGTLLGLEANAMQFYPDASHFEARVHPGLYSRREGQIDLSSIRGPGFGYRLAEIERELPEPVASFGKVDGVHAIKASTSTFR
jgi:L-alanine-DL-glutamate epimerase-like enolase superfamily enzyme